MLIIAGPRMPPITRLHCKFSVFEMLRSSLPRAGPDRAGQEGTAEIKFKSLRNRLTGVQYQPGVKLINLKKQGRCVRVTGLGLCHRDESQAYRLVQVRSASLCWPRSPGRPDSGGSEPGAPATRSPTRRPRGLQQRSLQVTGHGSDAAGGPRRSSCLSAAATVTVTRDRPPPCLP